MAYVWDGSEVNTLTREEVGGLVGGKQRAYWDRYADGRFWVLERWRDMTFSGEAGIRNAASRWAMRRGMRASVRKVPWGCGAYVVRFVEAPGRPQDGMGAVVRALGIRFEREAVERFEANRRGL